MSCNELILLSTDPDDIAILEGPGVQSVNGKVGKVVLDAGDFEYDDTKEYSAGSVGAELKELSQKEIDVDSALSLTSENPVQNKVVAQEINDKADVIISTALGSIAHFEDGAEADAVSVIAHIEPVQDLNGYDHPWAGGSGRNKLENNCADAIFRGSGGTVTATVNPDGSITINSDITSTVVVYGNIQTGFVGTGAGQNDGKKHLANGTYIISPLPSGITFQVYGTDAESGTGDLHPIVKASSGEFIIDDTYAYNYCRLAVSKSFTDQVVYPMIRLASDTDDTYEPYENICPLTGHTEANVMRTGRNLLPYPYVQSSRTTNGVTITVNNDGSITLSGTATASFYHKLSGGYATDHVAVSALFNLSERYIISGSLNGMYVQCVFYDADGNTITTQSNAEFSIPVNAVYYGIFLQVLNRTQTDTTIYPMLRFASDTDDTYKPYQGETYPITFPTEAGEVFGGYVDVTQGKLVVDRAKSTVVSSMTFGTFGSSGHGWYIARSSIAPLKTGKNYDTGIVCDKLPTAIGASTLAQDLIFVNTNGQIRINTAQVFNTKEDMLSYFGDSIDIVYPIEPITYQLTPQQITTLLGTNNIWNDCNGNTDVEYKADTKLYIEQLTKPTEDDMTANTNIASGKFFSVGNRLFLSTSAIASGDTINPGTNCTELSLADALNNLN